MRGAAGGAPYPGKAKGPGDHLRDVFYRMGLNDQEIVALSGRHHPRMPDEQSDALEATWGLEKQVFVWYAGAHTLGRAKPDRSGFGKESTKYTKDGPGKPGGSSWTPEWLKFDNSYFTVSPPSYSNTPAVSRSSTVGSAVFLTNMT